MRGPMVRYGRKPTVSFTTRSREMRSFGRYSEEYCILSCFSAIRSAEGVQEAIPRVVPAIADFRRNERRSIINNILFLFEIKLQNKILSKKI